MKHFHILNPVIVILIFLLTGCLTTFNNIVNSYQHNFSMQYPEDWKVYHIPFNGTDSYCYEGTVVVCKSSIIVAKTDKSLEEMFSFLKNHMQNYIVYQENGEDKNLANITCTTDEIINDNNVKFKVLMCSIQTPYTEITNDYLFFMYKDKSGYLFTISFENEQKYSEKYGKTFEQIISTFKTNNYEEDS